MGGGNAGEVASALAVEAIQTHLAEAARQADLPLIGPYDATVSAPANRSGQRNPSCKHSRVLRVLEQT